MVVVSSRPSSIGELERLVVRIYESSESEAIPVDTLRHEIRQSLKEQEASVIFYELKKLMPTYTPAQHIVAHIYGEELYRAHGIDGIDACDESFAFGCFHGFFGRAVAEEGIEIVSALDERCIQTFGIEGLGCPHGIGHGLGEYYGPDQLDSQLETCAELTWNGAFFGCSGGVFMEYFFPVVIDGDTAITSVRPYDEEYPHDPCDRIDERFRQSCYLELSARLYAVYPQDFAKLGDICDLATGDDSFVEACFRGLGYTFAPSMNYDKDAVDAACLQMPSDESIALCLAGASWSFFANPQYRELATEVCSGAQEPYQKFCRQKSQLHQEML